MHMVCYENYFRTTRKKLIVRNTILFCIESDYSLVLGVVLLACAHCHSIYWYMNHFYCYNFISIP